MNKHELSFFFNIKPELYIEEPKRDKKKKSDSQKNLINVVYANHPNLFLNILD